MGKTPEEVDLLHSPNLKGWDVLEEIPEVAGIGDLEVWLSIRMPNGMSLCGPLRRIDVDHEDQDGRYILLEGIGYLEE